jgi:hypothetical protein
VERGWRFEPWQVTDAAQDLDASIRQCCGERVDRPCRAWIEFTMHEQRRRVNRRALHRKVRFVPCLGLMDDLTIRFDVDRVRRVELPDLFGRNVPRSEVREPAEPSVFPLLRWISRLLLEDDQALAFDGRSPSVRFWVVRRVPPLADPVPEM